MSHDSRKAIRQAMMIARRGHDGCSHRAEGDALDRMNPRMLPGIHLRTNHRFADGGTVGQQDIGFDAYHGSPHEFDHFDIAQIGTGDGAQAYGHGLYFAEDENVARRYREDLARSSPKYVAPSQRLKVENKNYYDQIDSLFPDLSATPKQVAMGAIDRNKGDIKETYRQLTGRTSQTNKEAAQIVGALRGKKIDYEPPFEGHMYHVRVKANPDHFLDWNAPLKDQSEHVKEMLKQISPTHFNDDNMSGEDVYRCMNRVISGKPELASKDLLEAGIPGVKYFDAASRAVRSRGKGNGTRNYVVFDHNLIEVKRRYADGGNVKGSMNPRSLPGIHLRTNHRFADGGTVGQQDIGFDAYHGSPHEFEQFDVGKIGTGEGAQSYGHGLYFAENERVAKEYRDALSERTRLFQGKPIGEIEPEDELQKAIIHHMLYSHADDPFSAADRFFKNIPREELLKNGVTPPSWDEVRAARDAVNKDFSVMQSGGHMYHVRVKANPEHFLDWDAPLSEQHPQVVQALDQTFPSAMDYWRIVEGKAGDNGGYFHAIAAEDLSGNKKKRHEQIASKLQSAGVPGIKYFDAGSRGKGDGTRNYVVFDHNLIEVKRRYADGGEITPPRDLGADPTVQRALDVTRQAKLPASRIPMPVLADLFRRQLRGRK